jgi:predicted Zn-dependent protease with MMP-like domain
VIEVSAEQFEALVDEALASIPRPLLRRIRNVAIQVDDWPPPGQHLLGLYRGVPLTARGHDYAGVLPDTIQIFRYPILRQAVDADDVVELVRTTVLHEVAHHFGIDDHQLDELGYG